MRKIGRIVAVALIFCMTEGSVFSKGGLRYRVVSSGEVNVYMLHDFSLQDVVISASVNCNGTEYKFKVFLNRLSLYKEFRWKLYSQGRTKGTEYTLDNLAAGKKYSVEIVPGVTFHENIISSGGKEVSIYTLNRPYGIAVRKTSGKIRISWNSVSYADGYEISRSTKRTGTNVIATGVTSSVKTISAGRSSRCYYKVRAYKSVGGKKIYILWSKAVLKQQTWIYKETMQNTEGLLDGAFFL